MSSDHRKLSTAAELETKHQRTLEEKNAQFAMCIPGLGGQSNQPKPRVFGTSFFGYVPDEFSMKTPSLPSERSTYSTQLSSVVADKAKTSKNNPVRRSQLHMSSKH
jgi:hypothetical protein